MTHTKKKSPSADVVASAWEAYFEERKSDFVDIDEMRAKGWITTYEFAERIGITRNGVVSRVQSEKLLTVKKRARWKSQLRNLVFIGLPGKAATVRD